MQWKLALIALLLTAGPDTPLGFDAVNSETGASMETWGDYLEDCNLCMYAGEDSFPPGVREEIPGCVWVLVWIEDSETGIEEYVEQQPLPGSPESGACGRFLSWGKE